MTFLEIPPNIDPNVVRPGLGALLLVIGMMVVVGLLGWSMLRHMRRIDVPYADDVNGTEDGLQSWASQMRANSPDHDEDDDDDAAGDAGTHRGTNPRAGTSS